VNAELLTTLCSKVIAKGDSVFSALPRHLILEEKVNRLATLKLKV